MLRVVLFVGMTLLFCGVGAMAQFNSLEERAQSAETDQLDQVQADNSDSGTGLPGYQEFRDDPNGPDMSDPNITVTVYGQGLVDAPGSTMCEVDGNCD
jgi:hypothetical protein